MGKTLETLIGEKGQTVQDGEMGDVMKRLADAVNEYVDSDDDNVHATRIADLACELSNSVLDLFELLGWIAPTPPPAVKS